MTNSRKVQVKFVLMLKDTNKLYTIGVFASRNEAMEFARKHGANERVIAYPMIRLPDSWSPAK